jgi:hypothetical protein
MVSVFLKLIYRIFLSDFIGWIKSECAWRTLRERAKLVGMA